MSKDNLLTAYDYIRDELAMYNKALGITVNEPPNNLPISSPEGHVAMLDDWAYLKDHWKDVITAAKNRFGAADVERALAHLGYDKDGKSTRGMITGP